MRAIETVSAYAYLRIAQRLSPSGYLLRTWPLAGGVSAQVTALALREPGGQQRIVVVRRYGPRDLQANPHVAQLEMAVLRHAAAAGLPVPQPYFADETGELWPTPYSVIDYVPDAAPLAPADLPTALPQLADFLARLHQLPTDAPDLAALPNATDALAQRLATLPAELDDSLSEGRVRKALTAALPHLTPRPAALLHGDFWPGNTLWRGPHLAAVIDWEDAQRGDPLADLGNARLELAWVYGEAAAQAFTDYYARHSAVEPAALAVWDLAAALRPAGKLDTWGLSAEDAASMRAAHARFVEQALARLPGR